MIFYTKACGLWWNRPGEIGFIVTGIKDLSDTRLEIQLLTQSSQQINRYLDSSLANLCILWFVSVDGSEYSLLKDSIAKLKLNDSSISYEPENSLALGLGFRCGFLGLLHLEIVVQRLSREYGINLSQQLLELFTN